MSIAAKAMFLAVLSGALIASSGPAAAGEIDGDLRATPLAISQVVAPTGHLAELDGTQPDATQQQKTPRKVPDLHFDVPPTAARRTGSANSKRPHSGAFSV